MQIQLKQSWVWVFTAVVCNPLSIFAQPIPSAGNTAPGLPGIGLFLLLVLLVILGATFHLSSMVRSMIEKKWRIKRGNSTNQFEKYLEKLDSRQIEKVLQVKKNQSSKPGFQGSAITKAVMMVLIVSLAALFPAEALFERGGDSKTGFFSEGGIIITIVLVMIPILAGIVLMIVKFKGIIRRHRDSQDLEEASKFAE